MKKFLTEYLLTKSQNSIADRLTFLVKDKSRRNSGNAMSMDNTLIKTNQEMYETALTMLADLLPISFAPGFANFHIDYTVCIDGMVKTRLRANFSIDPNQN
tara:strand:- start:187 stop:489 length:303 start_codon:yes stop_codon:yes gene_type:complete